MFALLRTLDAGCNARLELFVGHETNLRSNVKSSRRTITSWQLSNKYAVLYSAGATACRASFSKSRTKGNAFCRLIPFCGMTVEDRIALKCERDGQSQYFCSPEFSVMNPAPEIERFHHPEVG